MSRTLLLVPVALIAFSPALIAEPPARPASQDSEFFETKVRPLLVEQCQSCHGAVKQKGDLRLDSRAAMLKGNDFGPVIVPGDPAKSRLIQAVRRIGEVKMPPDKPMPDSSVAILTEWVSRGAPWPNASVQKNAAAAIDELAKKHWAFQPVKALPLPAVQNAAWPITPIDRFILATLEAKKL